MKKVFIKTIISIISILIVIGVFNIVVDPYFHYHKPLSFLEYPIEFERYQNDGIAKNFDYDAIITGSSMCENFKTSELDSLFGTNSVKLTNSGGSYKEMNDIVLTALNNNDVRIVIRGLDYTRLLDNKDEIRYDEDWYPTYLYDDKLMNDVKYIFNKSTTMSSISVVMYTILGYETTSFDDYSYWMKDDKDYFGKEFINYSRPKKIEKLEEYSNEDFETEKANFEQNVISVARDNPNVEFYYFFTPYCICHFDYLKETGLLVECLEAEKNAIELMLECENIRVFSFFDEPEIICNLDNYKDMLHYSADINSYILECMKNGDHLLTEDNYLEYCEKEKEFFMNYDYDSLFE